MAHADAHHGHHVTPQKLLLKVFGALVALTVLTVLTAQVDLGAFNVPLAILIASTKASLVVLFFMALKYDNKVNTLVFSVGTIFVVIFLVFTLFDTRWRGDMGNVAPETITDELRDNEAAAQIAEPHDPEEEGDFIEGGDTPREPAEDANIPAEFPDAEEGEEADEEEVQEPVEE